MRKYIDAIALLQESVDFHPAVTRKDGDHTYVDYPEGTQQQREIDCQECHHMGASPKCRYCHGTGKEKEWITTCPELNVSNANAGIIAEILGHAGDDDGELTGLIPNAQLPTVMRRLIKLKNGNKERHIAPSSVSQRQSVSHDGNVASIQRGPTMIDMGVSSQQIERYVDRLIEMVRWAQEHQCDISWA